MSKKTSEIASILDNVPVDGAPNKVVVRMLTPMEISDVFGADGGYFQMPGSDFIQTGGDFNQWWGEFTQASGDYAMLLADYTKS